LECRTIVATLFGSAWDAPFSTIGAGAALKFIASIATAAIEAATAKTPSDIFASRVRF
jgi:hypothetical protein